MILIGYFNKQLKIADHHSKNYFLKILTNFCIVMVIFYYPIWK